MTFPDLYLALWRRRRFILVMTSLLVAATWYLTSQQTPEYQASTLVRVQQSAQDASDPIRSLDLGERLARTYAEIATTRELSARIEDQLGGSVPFEAIHGHISADPVQDLELLTISARNPDPAVAQRIANAAPPALLEFIRQKGTLREQIVTVESAAAPTQPVSPNMKFNLTMAIILGLLFNGALALLLEVLSDRLPKTEELEQVAGLPVLAVIPMLSFTRVGGGERPFTLSRTAREPPSGENGAAPHSEKASEASHG